MTKYIDICLAKIDGCQPLFCVAPAWKVNTGDIVIVDGNMAQVLWESTVPPESEIVNLALCISQDGCDEPMTLKDLVRVSHICKYCKDPFAEDEDAE